MLAALNHGYSAHRALPGVRTTPFSTCRTQGRWCTSDARSPHSHCRRRERFLAMSGGPSPVAVPGFSFGTWELEYRIHDALNISTDDAVRCDVAIEGAGEQARTKDAGYAIHRLHFWWGGRKMQP